MQDHATYEPYFDNPLSFPTVNSMSTVTDRCITLIFVPPTEHRRQDGRGASGPAARPRAPAARRGRHLVLSRLWIMSEQSECELRNWSMCKNLSVSVLDQEFLCVRKLYQ